VEGTAIPAFGDVLSEGVRWRVINRIRSVANPATGSTTAGRAPWFRYCRWSRSAWPSPGRWSLRRSACRARWRRTLRLFGVMPSGPAATSGGSLPSSTA